MKCINCGKEIKSEFNICPYCGAPIQIVPDYTIYDDDDINVLLECAKDVESKNNKAYIKAQKEKEKQKAFENKKQEQMKKTVLLVGVICAALFIVAIIGKIIIDVGNNSSYSYQMKQASSAMFKEDYSSAEVFYLRALELEPEDIKARTELAELYILLDKDDNAEVLLKEVIAKDSTNTAAYKMLIAIYGEEDDVDAILELKKGVTDGRILQLFSNYSVSSPKISLAEGTYADDIVITISADKNVTIYYTLDGSDPTKYGKVYSSGINIDEAGMHTLKAVAKNEHGVYSNVVSSVYVIEYEAPSDPVVTPDGGQFTSEKQVTIYVPSGCSAYYTWDNTTPTERSLLYVSPIDIPEGYNILSVIIVDDKTGLTSGIYKGAFEYYPN